jgi:hypothetical protein
MPRPGLEEPAESTIEGKHDRFVPMPLCFSTIGRKELLSGTGARLKLAGGPGSFRNRQRMRRHGAGRR